MSKKGAFQRQKKKSGTMKTLKVILIVLLVILVIAVAAGVGVWVYLNKIVIGPPPATISSTEGTLPPGLNTGVDDNTEPPTGPAETTEVTEAPEETTEPETEATAEPTEQTKADYGRFGKIINILVVGQDSRPEEGHKLSDSIILFTLNKETKTLTLTSFLRDSYVDLPDYRTHTCGWNRINTAYALGYAWYGDGGAMDYLNLTIKKNFGVEVDGNVEISLLSFEKIIDVLGGVDILLEGDELAYMNQCVDNYREFFGDQADELFTLRYFEEGTTTLTGMEALWYARMRHANDSDSDFNRTERQRKIVNQVMSNLKNNIFKINEIVEEVIPLILTNIPVEDRLDLIADVLPYLLDLQIVSNQCPAEGTSWGDMVELPDGVGGVLRMDFNKNKEILMAICEDND